MESKVFNIDCMVGMAEYPDKYFDLAVVDPPYGININISMGRRKGDKKSDYHKFAGNDESIPDERYFVELKRVSKNQIIWGGNYMTNYLLPSSCWLLWDKGFSEDVSFAQFEMAWTSFFTSAKKFDKHPSQQNRIHPTQKPVALYDWIYSKYLPEGGKVIDTHLGSGSNRIAADKAGNIDFVGYELDKDYFEAQEKRWTEYKMQQKLF
jgi:site-specific DNA-methyltransferase (adenine-specific)